MLLTTLTREELELSVRGLVYILAGGKLSKKSAQIASALVNLMLDELWEVNPAVNPPIEDFIESGKAARAETRKAGHYAD